MRTVSVGRSAARNVDPRIAAAVILLVLVAIQYFWWQGLVAVHRGTIRGGPSGPSRGAPPELFIGGLHEVQVDTLAGAQDPGDTDGNGRDARFDGPTGIALDRSGALYVADTRNNRLRVVTPDGHTSTLAGSMPGLRDGPVGQSLFNGPTGVAVGPDGAIYVADTGNQRIRRIQGGQVSTIAGGSAGMADGPAATARFNLPTALAWSRGAQGQALLIADSGNRRIRLLRLTSPATVQTVRATAGVPSWVAARASDIAVPLPDQSEVDLGAARIGAVHILQQGEGVEFESSNLTLHHPVSAAAAPDGWYLADASHGALFLVRRGAAQVIAGICRAGGVLFGDRDGFGDKATFGLISSIVPDGHGRIYVADTSNNAVRRITLPQPGSETGDRQRSRWHPGSDQRQLPENLRYDDFGL